MGNEISSIEYLDLKDLSSRSKWILIELAHLPPRKYPAVCLIDSSRFVIMGGMSGYSVMKDAVIFDTRS